MIQEKQKVRLPKTLTSEAPPAKLIDHHGGPTCGHFDGPVESLGVDDFIYFNSMDKPASALSKYFDFKQFQFVSLVTPHYVIGVAIADIRYVGSAFCYLYDIKNNHLLESNWLRPFGMGYEMSDSPMDGDASIGGRRGKIAFKIQAGQWRLKLQALGIDAEVELFPPGLSLPMAMCNPTGYNGWTYTQKHNALSVKGRLSINHEPQPLNRVLGGYDFSAGFMRRDTSWRWASINAQLPGGTLGLNLAAGVNETGCNENVFWFNGERHLLGPVHFEFDRHGLSSTGKTEPTQDSWRIYSDNGQISLYFTPHNCRQERLNLWLLKSNFRQYLGYFDGTVTDNAGIEHRLDNVLGLTEDHYARW